MRARHWLGAQWEKRVNCNRLVSAAIAAAILYLSNPALAQPTASCGPEVTRQGLVPCALRASLSARAQEAQVAAATARRDAVSPVLPSNPVVSFSAGRRNLAEAPVNAAPTNAAATNWYITLSQEVEVAGQRGARRSAAAAGITAESARLRLTRREVARDAWLALFDELAAREHEALISRLAAATRAVQLAARARAEKGVGAPVEADVAQAIATRAEAARLEAVRSRQEAAATLALLVGLGPGALARGEGTLRPLGGFALDVATSTTRPEIVALEAERQTFSLRVDAQRRSRITNPTLSVFAQNDGFNERVFGAGISLPIPLPGNVGRTLRGDIAESEAAARGAGAERDRAARSLALNLVTAKQTFAARQAQVALFHDDDLARAEASLRDIATAVETGRVAVRDAVLTQQVLIDLLRASIEARRDLCAASVELAMASGVALEDGAAR